MISTGYKPVKSKVLVVDDSASNTSMYHNVSALIEELNMRDITVSHATSLDDGIATASSDASIHGVFLNWELQNGTEEHYAARLILDELSNRHANIPVFLMATHSDKVTTIDESVMKKTTEFVWMLQDTADFIAGRMIAAVKRYRDQLLPPFAAALAKYSQRKEHSWSAPGHQGGIAFTKLPVGRAFFDFYGENLFRTDMGIERGELGSLLDHSGPVADSEKYAAQVFGADRSYNVVGGTSGSNRTIMQACLVEDEIAICDRNCHKSIEQGLMLTGARPVYLVPTRNQYGIIGPVPASDMSAQSIQDKVNTSPLTKDLENKDAVYSVLTSCTYDGLCYNAEKAENLLGQSAPRVHMDEAWYGYARFNPIYDKHFAMRDEAKGDPNAPTVFATHSTHKLLAALSQASYIHVREGRDSIPHDRFNQSYMMHATTSPLYSIVASNDIASAMMDGNGGKLLTNEAIEEAIGFRQAVGRLNKKHLAEGDWFFKPWNAEVVTDPETGETFNFEDAPMELLSTEQGCWRLDPQDKWHGFNELEDNWVMLDPIKVSLLTPGMDEEGNLLQSGVPAELFTAYASQFGIVPTRTTDFQVMFLFSIGVTRGKWATLVNTMLNFKRMYDNNTPLEQAIPGLVKDNPERYAGLGLKDLGDQMFDFIKNEDPGTSLNRAYSSLPEPVLTPRDTFQRLVKDQVELVPADKLHGRVAANAVMPYPPGIPMMMSGEKFDEQDSPQIDYLVKLGEWDLRFPGFEHEVEGAEVKDGTYCVLCLK
ncbi:arginine decarboxylase [Vibrio parahaemolyticus]|uniref:arginine decarboxylase n=1 Tax=Vibrio parahaemolyticus TaxID=670 RepID=UPI001A31041C|nr:arginine decarboxylase [Vibrio parahaemolyticus]EID0723668.1 arginine decarboxylase [Vibrio parahaemolyticus]EJG1583397.1 arginine decarboxylase [Vibrio parahaemolyticus]HCH3518764.1 arginine decarboxylase [Vibrio parahaemolyticus]HCH6532636.1 arginine decarboxylase [Vibrio parahaemolyticus]